MAENEEQLRYIMENGEKTENKKEPDGLLFKVDERPPMYITILYAFQMVLSNLDGTIIVVYMIHASICAEGNNVLFAKMMGTAIFMGGICTLLQTTIGVRLPVYQGSTKAFLPAILAMMATDTWACQPMSQPGTTGTNITTDAFLDEPWRIRLQEISGALIVCSVIQIVLGLTGIMGTLMSFIGPLTIAPTIMMMALSLFRACVKACQHQWGIAILTMALIMFFPLVLGKVLVPVPSYNKTEGWHAKRYPMFKLFPQILAIGIAWALSGVLTAAGVFPDNPDTTGFRARTDAKIGSLQQASWFYIPYPFQWGTPRFSVGIIGGMIAAILSSILDSIGDYIATARACNLPLPPKHAVNRGIAVEGLATVLSGLVGAAHGTSTYGRAVGLIAITGVGSRVVMQLTGVLLMVFAVLGKLGALFTLIPDPIIGGMATTACSIIIGVALSNLSYVDLKSSRNQFILGFSTLMGLMLPYYITTYPSAVNTGVNDLDSVIKVVLSTGMLVSALIALFLDNTLPGSKEMRGIIQMKTDLDLAQNKNNNVPEKEKSPLSVYDLPFMGYIKKCKLLSHVPICPTYKEFKIRKKRKVQMTESSKDLQEKYQMYIEVATV